MRLTAIHMYNTKRHFTIAPLSYAAPVGTPAEFMRLPASGERDPIFGLSRGYLNTLILPTCANGYRPPVVSCVLRQRGARTGVRLINIESLRRFILKHQEPTSIHPAEPEENKNPGADI